MNANRHGAIRILFVGESWVRHTVHVKGFDSFSTTDYEEGASVLLALLEEAGSSVTYVRAHEILARFPDTREELATYDVVVLSDVGANSFLLTETTFVRSERTVNRLALIADYVQGGGGLVMVGGYMSFTGIDGKARYKMSPLADLLPVEMLDYDDRVEVPEGATATIDIPGHEVLGGTPSEWPVLLGYNRVVAKGSSEVVARCGLDPLLVVGRAGRGRTVAFTSDLAPHWAPPEFLAWSHYGRLWRSILTWASSVEPAEAV
jgi:uncharacterized membrane protein